MTYNPSTPQPSEIPSQSQTRFLTNFTLFNQYFGQDHTPAGNVITLATNTAPIVITSAGHGLSTGNMVTVYDITGIEGNTPVAWPINGNTFTITVIDVNTFSLQGSDATGYPAYLTGTGNFSSASYLYGYHKQLTAATGLTSDPQAGAAGGQIYSKFPRDPEGNSTFDNPDFFFRNSSIVDQLTRLFNNAQTSTTGKLIQQSWGFVTPWGLIINVGFVPDPASAPSGKFSKPYSTVNYGVVVGCANPGSTRNFVVAVAPLGSDPNMLTKFGINIDFPSSSGFKFNLYYISMGI